MIYNIEFDHSPVVGRHVVGQPEPVVSPVLGEENVRRVRLRGGHKTLTRNLNTKYYHKS